MSLPEPRRGEVWLAELDKRRPVVVLTRDPLGRLLHSVIIGPVTSTVRGLSTEGAVGSDDGLRVDSVVNLDNPATDGTAPAAPPGWPGPGRDAVPDLHGDRCRRRLRRAAERLSRRLEETAVRLLGAAHA